MWADVPIARGRLRGLLLAPVSVTNALRAAVVACRALTWRVSQQCAWVAPQFSAQADRRLTGDVALWAMPWAAPASNASHWSRPAACRPLLV
eukprot:10404341-Alexandrium_andersonii.AAC.1